MSTPIFDPAVWAAWSKGLLVLDAAGRLEAISPAARDMLGLGDTDLAQQAHDTLCAETRDAHHEACGCPLFSAPSGLHSGLWKRDNGLLFHVDWRRVGLPDGRSVIEFKDAYDEGHSRTELAKFSLLTEHNPSPMLELDERGLIQFSNPAMTELMLRFGFDDDGHPAILPPDMAQLAQQCLTSGNPLERVEREFHEHWFWWNFHPCATDGWHGVLVTGLDVTERKLLELQQAEWQALVEREKQKARREYLAKVTHDLRSPLNAVVGYATLLVRKLGERLKDDERTMLEHIANAGHKLADQITESLQQARADAATFELDKCELDIGALLGELCFELRPLAEQKGLAFEVQLPADDLHCIADPERLKRVLANLTANAIKYTPRGSVTLSAKRETDDVLGDCIAISVQDTGPGIPQDEQDRIFEAFQRLRQHQGSGIEGTGLGLSIALELTRLHGGRIALHSTRGSGSCFTVLLPHLASV